MRKALAWGAKIAVSVGLLWYLFRRVDLTQVGERLSAAPSSALWLLGGLATLQAAILLARWRLVTVRSGETLPLTACVSNICMGMLFNQVLLSAIGGDAVRVVDLIRRKIGVERAVTLIFVDRLTALLGMGLLIAAMFPGFFLRDDPTGRLAAAGLGLTPIAVGAVAGLVMLLLLDEPPLAARLGAPGRVAGRFWTALRRVLADRIGGVTILGFAVVIHAVSALNVHLFAQAFGVNVGLTDCLMLAPPVFLLATLPLSVGGWGVREGGFVVAFAMVGVGEADAFALSVAIGLLGMAQGALGGGVWLLADLLGASPAAAERGGA